ncbi:hypothetical protein OPIT5_02830 [Opitutaceae bacterium TAV5]|nr:hypothetical protein OPIT5_02830 [Opitutaceae bacterium TAV5]
MDPHNPDRPTPENADILGRSDARTRAPDSSAFQKHRHPAKPAHADFRKTKAFFKILLILGFIAGLLALAWLAARRM